MFLDSFDHYSASEIKWGSGGFTAVTGRDGVGSAASVGTTGLTRTLETLTTNIEMGFAYKNGSGASFGPFGLIKEIKVTWNNEDFTNIRLYLSDQYQLYIDVFNNTFGVFPSDPIYTDLSTHLQHDTWYYINFLITNIQPGGCDFQVYINGQLGAEGSWTWNNPLDRLSMVGLSESCYRGSFDDMYQEDSIINWGDIRVGVIKPTADVTSDFTPSTGVNNYANVDETPPNSDTDYNSASVTAVDTFTMETVDSSYDLRGVQLIAFAKKGNAGTCTLSFAMQDGVNFEYLGTFYPTYGQYRYFTFGLTYNPFTGNPFTDATEFNALAYGYRRN